jgi:hypothetical protein
VESEFYCLKQDSRACGDHMCVIRLAVFEICSGNEKCDVRTDGQTYGRPNEMVFMWPIHCSL